jgi:hypothetical protein
MYSKIPTKEELFTIRTIPNGRLNILTRVQLVYEYETLGLQKLMNSLIGICIPTDAEEKHIIRYNDYIFVSICCCIGKLLNAIYNSILLKLSDACWDLLLDARKIDFYDRETNTIKWTEHDKDLKSFEIVLRKHVNILNECKSCQIMLVIFARTIFEHKQFQAPYRTTPQEAIRDAMGLSRDNLWNEYIEKWGLMYLF